jgi:cobaltochelatase CobN
MVNALFAWSATTRLVTKNQFDRIVKRYLENEDNKQWLAKHNIYALEEITRRLLEASSRELWQADEEQLEQLHQAVLEVEGDLEERMGPVRGEFQGGSVDIKTRESVKEWSYDYTLE